MLVIDFDKTNFMNLIKLITASKKIFLLCYSNSKESIEPVNEWYLLQVFKKYIPSDDVIIAKLLVEPRTNILKMFPRIDATGNEIPRVVFINGLNSIKKYDSSHILKEYIKWIKETLETLSVNKIDYTIDDDDENNNNDENNNKYENNDENNDDDENNESNHHSVIDISS
jgi:hypothetical protein